MFQRSNIIRADEGGVSAPYVVHERLSSFASPTLREGLKLIREQQGQEAFLLVCQPIADAVFEDIVPPEVPVEPVVPEPVIPDSPVEPVAEVKHEPSDTYNQTVMDNNGNTNKTEEVTT